LIAAHGCLAGLKKGQSQLPLKKAEGLLENEPESEAGSCIVCSHAEVETTTEQQKPAIPLSNYTIERF
jgi:hypothetical protein